ncbi:MAG: cation diffusion facilitator family transporter [Deinococcota bacterium]
MPTLSANRAALLAFSLGLLVLALKLLAYGLTGSVALLSDALESVINVVTALVALIAVRLAQRPADTTHPYGHSKIEYLSAVLEGVLIVLAALLIIQQASVGLVRSGEVDGVGLAALVSLGASAVNAALAALLTRVGRRERSPALTADGAHLWADVVTSLGVLAGVGLVQWTGWWLLDPLLALLVALNILRLGGKLLRDSVGGLLDESLPEAQQQRLQHLLNQHLHREAAALEVHDLRTRRAGRQTFVTFHLIVPGDLPVRDAHALCDRLESAIAQDLSGSFTTIHVEPEEKTKRKGLVTRIGGT